MWEKFVECAKTRKIVCYGAGNNAKNLLKNVSFRPFVKQIVCFVDREKTKVGSSLSIDGRSIIINDFSYLDQVKDELVLVTISDYSDVGNELTKRGIFWLPWLEINMDLIFEQLKYRNGKKTAILLNTPNYLNLGDHAITIAEINVLKIFYNDVFELDTSMCNDSGLKKLKEYIYDDDIIYIQGGGNMGALWRTCENNLRRIIKNFPENNIFVFPQSIFYDETPENQQFLRDSIPIYNGHKHLKICLRDKKSFEFVKKTYSCKCSLVPDMVLTMKYQIAGNPRDGIGVLLRNDKERLLAEDYIDCINDTAKSLNKTVKLISHHADERKMDREVRLDKMLKIYAGCEVVITDRLHGMLFSAITNTPCIVFDNSYGKISSLHATWIKDNKDITIAEQLKSNELKNLILEKITTPSCEIRSDKFEDIILKELTTELKM